MNALPEDWRVAALRIQDSISQERRRIDQELDKVAEEQLSNDEAAVSARQFGLVQGVPCPIMYTRNKKWISFKFLTQSSYRNLESYPS